MKNYKIVATVLVVICLGVIAYFVTRNDNKARFKGDDSNFAVKDVSALDMIFIGDKKGRNHKFVKLENGRWLINDDYLAATYQMDMLLETLTKLEIKNPVPKSARNTVIKNLAVQGIKVELYQNKKIFKTFYVGGTTNDDLGTYFIMEGSENPYVVYIRQFTGFLTSRFEIKKHNWVDRQYFNCPKDQLTGINVMYTTDTLQGFTINGNNGNPEVDGMPDADSSLINKYVTYYSNLHVESFVENEKRWPIQDSLRTVTPFCSIELKSTDTSKNRTLQLYPFQSIDRMYGITEKGDLVTVQYFNFQKLLVSKSFFQKPSIIL